MPLFGKHHDPEDRPTRGEVIGCTIIAIVIGLGLWFLSIINSFPQQLQP